MSDNEIQELQNNINNDNIHYLLKLSYYKKIIPINNFIIYMNKLNNYSYYFLSVVCIYENQLDTFKLILDNVKFSSDEYMFIIKTSFIIHKTEFIKHIKDNCYEFTYDDFLKIYENACIYNNLDIVKLIDNYYNFSYDYYELAKMICKKCNKIDIISYFIIKNRIEQKILNQFMNELFIISCIYGNYKISKFIKNNYNITFDKEELIKKIKIHRIYYYDCVENHLEEDYKYNKIYKIIN